MSNPRYVLDASALLCVLFDEPGAEYVAERLNGALVSATNYTEVVSKLVDRGAPAEEIVVIMADLDIEVVAVDRHQAELAGLMWHTTRDAGLSIGDRACLALALTRKAIAVTTDRAWQKIELELDIEFAR